MLATSFVIPAVMAAATALTPAQDGYTQYAQRLAPGVHLLRQKQEFHVAAVSNVLVVEQADGMVLVDAGGSNGSGERIVELVRAISSKPVKAVIITHWHPDHTMGLPAIKRAWPSVEIIATTATRDHMLGDDQKTFSRAPDPAWDKFRIEQLRGYDAQLRPNVTDASITEAERKGWADTLDVLKLREADAPGTYLVAPTRTFTDSLTLADPERPVEVKFLGRGDTDGDAAVWLPKQKVLAIGDQMAVPVVYGFSVFQTEWIQTLGRLRDYPYAILVPGHGAPQTDKRKLTALIAMIADVRRQVKPYADTDLTLEQVQPKIEVEAARQVFAGDDPWIRYWFDQYTLAPMVNQALIDFRPKEKA